MSLFIEVYVGSKENRKLVASTHAYNVSDLNIVSDYEFKSNEAGFEPLKIPRTYVEGKIYSHRRDQSVWSLVEKIAKESYKKGEQ